MKDRRSTRPEYAPALAHERAIVRCVLPDAVRVDEFERALPERQRLPVGDGKARRELLEREILGRQCDRRGRDVDASDLRPLARETHEIGAGTASDFEHAAPADLVEWHQARQMVQLL